MATPSDLKNKKNLKTVLSKTFFQNAQKMRIFRCNFAKFSQGHLPGPPRMVVPSALPPKMICDVTRLRRHTIVVKLGPPLGNFLRTPLANSIATIIFFTNKKLFKVHCWYFL